MNGIAFDIRGLEVRRNGRVVVNVPALTIAPGESLAVLGPNGAGKSTLLAALAGLEAPAAGTVTIGGDAATALAARRRVALLPQDAPLLLGTVRANVERPLQLRGVAPADRHRRADAMLERMGLTALAGRPGASLSGGEARRVALARALVVEPAALLLDEPFNAIDEPSRARLLDDIAGSVAASGCTLVLVTQRRDEALRLCTRVAVTWDGEIRQLGPLPHVLAHPADAVTARFLGGAVGGGA